MDKEDFIEILVKIFCVVICTIVAIASITEGILRMIIMIRLVKG